MFCLRRTFIRAILLAILLSTAFADTIVLKNGQKLEGRVVKETDQQVTVEMKVSAAITDERVFTRAEIERIEKAPPETEDYKPLASLKVGPNSLAPAQYDPAIRALQAYVNKYPDGPLTADAKVALEEFLAEKKRVMNGEYKFRGQWLTKAEVQREKIQISGMLALDRMKAQSAAGDNIGALNTFVIAEKNYPGCASMPEMIELARQLIAPIKPTVERALADQKVLKAEKEKGFANAGPAERAEMMAAYKADLAQAEATAAAAESAGQWPPFNSISEKALTVLVNRVAKESPRLAALPVEQMKNSVQLTESARQSFAAGDLEGTLATLKEATTLWPANEMAGRLAKAVADKKAELAKLPPATPVPTPEALAKMEAAAQPKPAATPRPVVPVATPAPEEPSPFFMTLPGAIAIVLVIAASLAGLNIYMKKKKAQQPQVE